MMDGNGNDDVTITIAQARTLHRKWMDWKRDARADTFQGTIPPRDFAEFLRSVCPSAGYIAVPWCGMWLAIEMDGHAHT